MELLYNYLFFLAKIITFVIAIIALVAGIAATITKITPKKKAELCIENLSDRYEEFKGIIYAATLTKSEYKAFSKVLKQSQKENESRQSSTQKKMFVIKFCGDAQASQIEELRQEVTAVLVVAEPSDEVLVCVKSPGGTVPGYGLAAAQLKRFRDHNIRLTVAVDEVAASGGYMMAAVADHIIAAPFAIVGSVGVVGQLPNFNRWLKENHIDYELHTAGEFKRSLTLFGENTDKTRSTFKEELEQAHNLFKFLICNCCGNVNEIYAPVLEHAIMDAALGHDFSVENYSMEITGICRACATLQQKT